MNDAVIATLPSAPDRPNEDAAGALGDALVLMDGAGMPAATRAGCHHSVHWFAKAATGRYLHLLQDRALTMKEALAQTISDIRQLHDGECDLEAGSPSATVVATRRAGDRLEYLVLCDSTLAIATATDSEPAIGPRTGPRPGPASGVTVVCDDRLAEVHHPLDRRLAELRGRLDPARDAADPELIDTLRRRDLAVRNAPGGFWCVGHRPEAAAHALTGEVPLRRVQGVVLASDGAMRLAELFGELTPEQLATAYLRDGADRWLARTREVEETRRHEAPWRKAHDDATVVIWRAGASRQEG